MQGPDVSDRHGIAVENDRVQLPTANNGCATSAHNYTSGRHQLLVSFSHLLQIAAKPWPDSATRVPSSPAGKREKKMNHKYT